MKRHLIVAGAATLLFLLLALWRRRDANSTRDALGEGAGELPGVSSKGISARGLITLVTKEI